MTQHDDETMDDVAVAKAYRDLPDERAPSMLDDAILKLAATGVTPGRRRWSFTFMNPAGLVALTVLCFAVLVQLDPGTPSSGADTVSDLPLDLHYAPPRQPVPAGGIQGPTDASSISATGATSGEQLRGLANGTLSLQTGMPEAASAGEFAALAPDVALAQLREQLKQQSVCEPKATLRNEDWQGCIDKLARDGRLNEAQQERALKQQLFPAAAAVETAAPQ